MPSVCLFCLCTLLCLASSREQESSVPLAALKALKFFFIRPAFLMLNIRPGLYPLRGGGYIEVLVGRADSTINSCLCYEN